MKAASARVFFIGKNIAYLCHLERCLAERSEVG